MQIDVSDYLSLVERTNELAFFDIESTGFKADYDSTLCVSIKPYGKKPFTFSVKQVGNDQKVVREVRDILSEYQCWGTYYGKGFDVPFLNTRLLKWGLAPLEQRHHLDMYFTLKPKVSMSRKSLSQVAGFLRVHDDKIGVSPNVWSEISFDMKHMKEMVNRCEGDCITLEQIYDKTKHMVREIKRG